MTRNKSRDSLFTRPAYAKGFRFDERVAAVFDDMAERSIPRYLETQRLAAALAKAYARPGTAVTDLGCSTATTLCAIAETIGDPTVRLTGVDASAAMLEIARRKVARRGLQDRIRLQQGEIGSDVDVSGSSVVLMNWTLQFIAPARRLKILRRIREGLAPGGCLVLCEKIAPSDAEAARVFTDFYDRFKLGNGYSMSEIVNKRKALDGVLIPLTIEENLDLLRRAGFAAPNAFCQWFNFVGLVAFKRARAGGRRRS
jgi:tRNA (cmo5U34)-methyltransferase